jgi:hypothetical protein
MGNGSGDRRRVRGLRLRLPKVNGGILNGVLFSIVCSPHGRQTDDRECGADENARGSVHHFNAPFHPQMSRGRYLTNSAVSRGIARRRREETSSI